MLNPYNRFALILAAVVGIMCALLGIVSGNLFFLLIAGAIFYAVYGEFRRDYRERHDADG